MRLLRLRLSWRLAPWLAVAVTASACDAVRADPGVTAQEIIGGTETGAYPGVPLLYAEMGDGTSTFCTGTLISPRVVLTAAHCLELDGTPSVHVAYFGGDFNDDADPALIDTIDVAAIEFDTDWDLADPEGGHDIGMALLDRAAPALPMAYNHRALEGHEGDDLHLVGWGRTTGDSEDYGIKREATSQLQSFDDRLLRYGSATANTCQGDSGGPNFLVEGGEPVVVGITSFGNVGCDQYGFGTNVAAYAEAFVDPWLMTNDPDACTADGACVAACGQDDVDCPDDPALVAVTGGCRAGGRSAPAHAAALLLALLLLRRRRRRA